MHTHFACIQDKEFPNRLSNSVTTSLAYKQPFAYLEISAFSDKERTEKPHLSDVKVTVSAQSFLFINSQQKMLRETIKHLQQKRKLKIEHFK